MMQSIPSITEPFCCIRLIDGRQVLVTITPEVPNGLELRFRVKDRAALSLTLLTTGDRSRDDELREIIAGNRDDILLRTIEKIETEIRAKLRRTAEPGVN